MKNPILVLAIAAALVSCHRAGSDSTLQRKDQQQYDVVQEGQATGSATSTINAPGEVAPPPAPMTGTNADTTSNFTLPQVATSGTQAPGQPGTLAGQMPQVSPSGSMSAPGAPPRPRPAPRTDTAARTSTTEPQRTSPPPPRTDTTGTSLEGPPPSTSTRSPNTDTAPPPPPSTQTDTQAPPPTTTSTI